MAPSPLPCVRSAPLSVSPASRVGAKTIVAVTHTMALPQMEKRAEGEEAGEDCLVQTTSEGHERAFSQLRKQDKSCLIDHPSLWFVPDSFDLLWWWWAVSQHWWDTEKDYKSSVVLWSNKYFYSLFWGESENLSPPLINTAQGSWALCMAKTRHWGVPCTAEVKSGHRLVRVVWGSLCRACLSAPPLPTIVVM